MSRVLRILGECCVTWSLAIAWPAAAATVYVDDDAIGTGNGSSWCDAFVHLQDALAAAEASGGSVTEIRVAQGVYQPDLGIGQTSGDRLATFRLIDGVALIGGYAGCGQPDPDARDVGLYESLLSGDLLGDDGPDFANYAENSYHVVTYDLAGVTDVVLDGFVIAGGNADGTDPPANQGGGIQIRQGTVMCIPGGPTIRNCLVRDNWAANHGAVNDHAWNSVFENCTFRNNVSGQRGAGLFVQSGSATVSNCLFEGNSVGFELNQGEGGGAWVGHDNDPTCPAQHQTVFTDCVFRGNHSMDRGGGAFGAKTSAPRFVGCTFDDNTSDFLGGGAYMDTTNTDNPSTFISCTFSDNSAVQAGGGAYSPRGTYTDCTFTNNSATTGGGIGAVTPGPLVVLSSTFIGNVAVGIPTNGGGGIYVNTDGTIRNCLFRDNITDFNGGGVYNLGNELTVSDSTFINNEARLGGGILMYFGDGKLLTNCRFRGNSALWGGGAYSVGGPTTFVNCEFSGNQVTEGGGGILFNYDNIWMINCTVYGNTATQGGGLYASFGGSPNTIGSIYIDNSIFWGNSDIAGSGQSSQIFQDFAAQEILINYSDVQGWTGGFGGVNTINVDPLFVDPEGPDNIPGTEDDNLRLGDGSDCIDAGDNGAVPPGVTTDLDGRPRIENGTVDMGPYERGGCGDGECLAPEDACNCSEDCGPPPSEESACGDDDDEDCDGLTDCNDPDCANDPVCPQPCDCFANVNDEFTAFPVTFPDITAVAECAVGDCDRCVRSCDINCDGTVDYVDVGAAVCHFNAGTESGMACCELGNGACYDAPNLPECVITSADACNLFSGTYDGNDSTCECQGFFRLYGDVNDSGSVDFTDINLIVVLFQGGTPIPEEIGDIFPCGGDGIVNFQDITAAVETFQGNPPCPDFCL